MFDDLAGRLKLATIPGLAAVRDATVIDTAKGVLRPVPQGDPLPADAAHFLPKGKDHLEPCPTSGAGVRVTGLALYLEPPQSVVQQTGDAARAGFLIATLRTPIWSGLRVGFWQSRNRPRPAACQTLPGGYPAFAPNFWQTLGPAGQETEWRGTFERRVPRDWGFATRSLPIDDLVRDALVVPGLVDADAWKRWRLVVTVRHEGAIRMPAAALDTEPEVEEPARFAARFPLRRATRPADAGSGTVPGSSSRRPTANSRSTSPGAPRKGTSSCDLSRCRPRTPARYRPVNAASRSLDDYKVRH